MTVSMTHSLVLRPTQEVLVYLDVPAPLTLFWGDPGVRDIPLTH